MILVSILKQGVAEFKKGDSVSCAQAIAKYIQAKERIISVSTIYVVSFYNNIINIFILSRRRYLEISMKRFYLKRIKADLGNKVLKKRGAVLWK